MDLHPPATGFIEISGVRTELLGRVVSPRGVQLLAMQGLPNGKVENSFVTEFAAFAFVLKKPADTKVGCNKEALRPCGPLNFCASGVPITLRASGPLTTGACLFSPDFIARLSKTEKRVRLDLLECMTAIESARLTYLGWSIFREALEPGFASSLFAEALSMSIALEIARYDGAVRAEKSYRRGGLAPWQMNRLQSYIRDHLSEDLTLEQLALLIGISVRHLSRAVRQAKGVSVHRWIADCRFEEARRLLAETELPINEIARRAAFHSPAAFTTAFRNASGFAPGEFRRLTLG
jgi:AraC family transcriptional regulator